MITQPESGLTQAQYDVITNDANPYAWKVEATRSNLQFKHVGSWTDEINSDKWDALVFGGKIVYATNENVSVMNIDGTGEIVVPHGLVNTATAPSLVEDGTNVYLFTYNTPNVIRHTINVADGTISNPVASTSSVTNGKFIAATSPTRCHVLRHLTLSYNYQFTYIDGIGGTDTLVQSDVWWQHPVQSFDAATDGSKDVVVIATQSPGLVRTKVDGTSVYHDYEPSGGVVAFTVINEMWSDHIEVDLIDNMSGTRMRRSVRVTYTNDRFSITGFAYIASKYNTIRTHKLYTSKTGDLWSMGRILYLPLHSTAYSIVLYPHHERIYAISGSDVFWDESTSVVGKVSENNKIVFTRDNVSEHTIEHGEITSATLVIDNALGEYDNHPIINTSNVIELYHYSGRYDLETNTPYYILVAITEVDRIDIDHMQTNRTITLVSRDRMAWMADRTQSEETRYWEGGISFADQYSDFTETGYGGLVHTAIQRGQWETEAGDLWLKTPNEYGLSFSTHQIYHWNGSYKIHYNLSEANNNEYAGVVFRALNQENYMAARFEQASNEIRLYEYRSGSEITIMQSSGLNPVNPMVGSIWVHFKYGRVKVFFADDGVNWRLAINTVVSGMPDTYINPFLDRGYSGQVAKGDAPVIDTTINIGTSSFNYEEYRFDPISFDTIEFPQIPYITIDDGTVVNPVVSTSNLYPDTTTRMAAIVHTYVMGECNIYIKNNWRDELESWTPYHVYFPSGPPRAIYVDPRITSQTNAWVYGLGGVSYIEDVFGDTATPRQITHVLYPHDITNGAAMSATMDVSMGSTFWILVVVYDSVDGFLAFTSYDNVTWNGPYTITPNIQWTPDPNKVFFFPYEPFVWIDNKTPGRAITSAISQYHTTNFLLYETLDYGQTWHVYLEPQYDPVTGEATAGATVHPGQIYAPIVIPPDQGGRIYYAEYGWHDVYQDGTGLAMYNPTAGQTGFIGDGLVINGLAYAPHIYKNAMAQNPQGGAYMWMVGRNGGSFDKNYGHLSYWENRTLFKSTNGGQTWQATDISTANGYNPEGVIVSGRGGSAIFVYCLNGKMIYSTDGGSTFTEFADLNITGAHDGLIGIIGG